MLKKAYVPACSSSYQQAYVNIEHTTPNSGDGAPTTPSTATPLLNGLSRPRSHLTRPWSELELGAAGTKANLLFLGAGATNPALVSLLPLPQKSRKQAVYM